MLIGTATALALAMILSLRVVRPIEKVSRASASIAEGRFLSSEPPKRTRYLPIELSELQERFHDMVGRLRENITTINGLAYVDSVTGIGNRTVLQRCLDGAMTQQIKGALLLIDLDGFKAVNDVHGHDVGDQVLQVVGARLCRVLGLERLSDGKLETFGNAKQFDGSRVQVARMGGDEFAVWLPHAETDDAENLAQEIVAALREPILAGGANASIGASVGVARSPENATDRSNLVKAADLALYDAKNGGKNRHTLFTPALRETLDAQRRLAEEIEAGLANGEFTPFFQPQFSLPDRSIKGVEALARWIHPQRGQLEPSCFLPTAREMGVLQKIDETVFEQSVQLLSDLAKSGATVGSLAVNVSEERLRSQDFLRALDHMPELPFEVRFELVETMVLDKIEGRLAWTLDRIREDGHKLDLDDFGSANASVLGLMNVEPAHLKIDRKLISGMQSGHVSVRLVRSIIEMGHSLDIPIIAEGAEDLSTVERLEEMRCDLVQGYALARPMSIDRLEAFLRDYRPMRPDTPLSEAG